MQSSALVCDESNCLPYGKELGLELSAGTKPFLIPKWPKRSALGPNSPHRNSRRFDVSAIAKGESVGIEWQARDLEN